MKLLKKKIGVLVSLVVVLLLIVSGFWLGGMPQSKRLRAQATDSVRVYDYLDIIVDASQTEKRLDLETDVGQYFNAATMPATQNAAVAFNITLPQTLGEITLAPFGQHPIVPWAAGGLKIKINESGINLVTAWQYDSLCAAYEYSFEGGATYKIEMGCYDSKMNKDFYEWYVKLDDETVITYCDVDATERYENGSNFCGYATGNGTLILAGTKAAGSVTEDGAATVYDIFDLQSALSYTTLSRRDCYLGKLAEDLPDAALRFKFVLAEEIDLAYTFNSTFDTSTWGGKMLVKMAENKLSLVEMVQIGERNQEVVRKIYTDASIAPGNEISVEFGYLNKTTAYEWYVKLDGKKVVTYSSDPMELGNGCLIYSAGSTVIKSFYEYTVQDEEYTLIEFGDFIGKTEYEQLSELCLGKLDVASNVAMRMRVSFGAEPNVAVGLNAAGMVSTWSSKYMFKLVNGEIWIVRNETYENILALYKTDKIANGKEVEVVFGSYIRTYKDGDTLVKETQVWFVELDGEEVLSCATELADENHRYVMMYSEQGISFIATGENVRQFNVQSDGNCTVGGTYYFINKPNVTLVFYPNKSFYELSSLTYNGQNVLDKVYVQDSGTVTKRGYYLPLEGCSPTDTVSVSFKTDYEETVSSDESVTVYDLYDMTGHAAFQTGGGDFYLGKLPVSSNVAYTFTVDMPETQTKKIFYSFFMGANSFSGASFGSGYFVSFLNGVVSIGSSNSLTVPFSEVDCENAAAGKSFILEVGGKDISLNGEKVGNYIYVKINGETILTYKDYAARNGSYKLYPYVCGGRGDAHSIRTTRDCASVSFEAVGAALNLPTRTYVADQNGEVAYYIPNAIGYKISAITRNGNSVINKLEKVASGYKLTLKDLNETEEIVATFTAQTVQLTFNQAENVTIVSAEESVGYGDCAVIALEIAEGYVLDSVSVNGNTGYTKSVRMEGSRVMIMLWNVTKDSTVAFTVKAA